MLIHMYGIQYDDTPVWYTVWSYTSIGNRMFVHTYGIQNGHTQGYGLQYGLA